MSKFKLKILHDTEWQIQIISDGQKVKIQKSVNSGIMSVLVRLYINYLFSKVKVTSSRKFKISSKLHEDSYNTTK